MLHALKINQAMSSNLNVIKVLSNINSQYFQEKGEDTGKISHDGGKKQFLSINQMGNQRLQRTTALSVSSFFNSKNSNKSGSRNDSRESRDSSVNYYNIIEAHRNGNLSLDPEVRDYRKKSLLIAKSSNNIGFGLKNVERLLNQAL